MKFRIIYKDKFGEEKTIVYEADSYWHAKTFGENVFSKEYVRCEEEIETYQGEEGG